MNTFVSRAKKVSAYKPLQSTNGNNALTAAGAIAAGNATTNSAGNSTAIANVKRAPNVWDMLSARDYTGAITLLDSARSNGEADEYTLPTLAYASFHLGDYQKAQTIYAQLCQSGNSYSSNAKKQKQTHHDEDDDDDDEEESKTNSCDDIKRKESVDPKLEEKLKNRWRLYNACCLFHLGNFATAESEAQKCPPSPLQIRLLFHIAHRKHDDNELMKYHTRVTESVADQLSLASMHYSRNHYQEATDIYKKLLLDKRDYIALQVYVAMCYYKLDYYDVSLEILAPYLQSFHDSATAINLKACNHYKLYDGKAAEAELKPILDSLQIPITQVHTQLEHDLLRHNLVVFRNGEHALQVLPPLIDIIPEARLNLVIHHMRNDEVDEAYALMQSIEPSTPHEYVLKGVVNAAIGQRDGSKEHIKLAQQYFQLVGASASECDTIPGRQSMASCFFLLHQFEDVLIYLNSIKAYSLHDSSFNLNYAIALCNVGQYKEAHEALLLVTKPQHLRSYAYLSHLARCLIMTNQPRLAWALYLKLESHEDSYALLHLIASDCYRTGQYLYAAKAYDVLERLEGANGERATEYWEGKRGACCGLFRAIISGSERKELIREVLSMLATSPSSPQLELIVRVITKWCSENGAV